MFSATSPCPPSLVPLQQSPAHPRCLHVLSWDVPSPRLQAPCGWMNLGKAGCCSLRDSRVSLWHRADAECESSQDGQTPELPEGTCTHTRLLFLFLSLQQILSSPVPTSPAAHSCGNGKRAEGPGNRPGQGLRGCTRPRSCPCCHSSFGGWQLPLP